MIELEVDDELLEAFFGVPPAAQGEDEKEFFGASTFEVAKGGLLLSVSFSRFHRDVILHLTMASAQQRIVDLHVRDVEELRVRDDNKRLFVLKRAPGSKGADPTLVEAVEIMADPIRVGVKLACEDGE